MSRSRRLKRDLHALNEDGDGVAYSGPFGSAVRNIWAGDEFDDVSDGMILWAIHGPRQMSLNLIRDLRVKDTDQPDLRGLESYEDYTVEVLFFFDRQQKLLAAAINLACTAQEVESHSAVNAPASSEHLRQRRSSLAQALLASITSTGAISRRSYGRGQADCYPASLDQRSFASGEPTFAKYRTQAAVPRPPLGRWIVWSWFFPLK